MGVKLRERSGKGWYVLIDHKGQRKAKFFGKNKKLAKEFKDKLEAKLKLGSVGITTKAGVKVEDYADTWLGRIQHTRKHSTHEDYQKMLKRDILPVLRGLDLEDVTREKVRVLAIDGLKRGQSPKTVQNVIRCLSSLLSHAVEDGLLSVNPALKPGKFLPKVSKRRGINPLTSEEVGAFLDTVKKRAPAFYAFFLCAVESGLRQGELIALQWGDLDFRGRFVEVQRSYSRGRIATPKSGETRRVDMSQQLTETLGAAQEVRELEEAATTQEAGQSSSKVKPVPWVFADEQGNMFHHNYLRNLFHRLLKAAGLRRVRFHDLRHTFASLLLQQGESPVYVKEQMGHSSIQVTVDLYGYLIPGGNKQAVDRLANAVDKAMSKAESATQPQPAQRVEGGQEPEPIEKSENVGMEVGVSDGFRTRNLWSHSPAL